MYSTGQPPGGAPSLLHPGGVHTRTTFSSFHLPGRAAQGSAGEGRQGVVGWNAAVGSGAMQAGHTMLAEGRVRQTVQGRVGTSAGEKPCPMYAVTSLS